MGEVFVTLLLLLHDTIKSNTNLCYDRVSCQRGLLRLPFLEDDDEDDRDYDDDNDDNDDGYGDDNNGGYNDNNNNPETLVQ